MGAEVASGGFSKNYIGMNHLCRKMCAVQVSFLKDLQTLCSFWNHQFKAIQQPPVLADLRIWSPSPSDGPPHLPHEFATILTRTITKSPTKVLIKAGKESTFNIEPGKDSTFRLQSLSLEHACWNNMDETWGAPCVWQPWHRCRWRGEVRSYKAPWSNFIAAHRQGLTDRTITVLVAKMFILLSLPTLAPGTFFAWRGVGVKWNSWRSLGEVRQKPWRVLLHLWEFFQDGLISKWCQSSYFDTIIKKEQHQDPILRPHDRF